MATYVPAKKNTAFIFYLPGLLSQANSKLFQVNPTLAAGDVKVTIDGGSAANLTTLPTVTPAGGTRVKISLSAAEMNGDNITVVFSDAAGAEWCDLGANIQTSARQIDDLAYPATSGRSMVVDAAGLVDANTVSVGPSGSGTAQTAGDLPGRLTATRAGYLDNLSAGAVALQSSLSALITTVGVAGAGLTAADDAVITAIAALNNLAAGAAMTLTAGERNSIADAFTARTLGVEAVSADGAVPTWGQAMFEILSLLGEFSISGTTITCKARNGVGTLFTSTLDSATAPTSRTRAT